MTALTGYTTMMVMMVVVVVATAAVVMMMVVVIVMIMIMIMIMMLLFALCGWSHYAGTLTVWCLIVVGLCCMSFRETILVAVHFSQEEP